MADIGGYDWQGNPILGGSYNSAGVMTGAGVDGYKQGYAPLEVMQAQGWTPEQIAAYQAQPKAQLQNTMGQTSGFSMVGGGSPAGYPSGSTAQAPAAPWSNQGGYTGSPAMGGGNPYLGGMADEIGRRTQLGLGDAFNSIRSDAIGVGGLGGSRQGVAQGVATGRAMDSLQGNLANLYGTSYQFDQGNATNQRGQDMNFYTQQRGQDQTGAALGADLYSRGISGEWSPIQQAGSAYSPYTGFGTTTQSGQSGGGWQGGVGGALAGASLGKQLGWW